MQPRARHPWFTPQPGAIRLVAAALFLLAPAPARAQTDTLGLLLRQRLSQTAPGAAGERLHAPGAVRRYFQQSGYRPLWTSGPAVQRAAWNMQTLVGGVAADGLEPRDYHAEALGRLLDPARRRGSPLVPVRERLELELLLTDAFLELVHDLSAGRVPPAAVHRAWSVPGREMDGVRLIAAAVQRGELAEALVRARPQSREYATLREALTRYRAFAEAGGWGALPRRVLRPGDRGAEVARLRERLAAEGYPAPAGEAYDDELAGEVRAFQLRHGLADDGVVGQATRAAFNVPVERRLRQLEAALERERWLPASLGRRYVAVYIPAFELEAVDGRGEPLRMRVIAGKPSWRTPIFSARMTTAVFNPYWNIPPSIWSREVAPRARRDRGYLSREGIHAVSDGGTVRWRQSPGPRNPLGEVKLVFPNPYNVYLHDTSTPSLFERDERALSHGCIRVAKPLELAAFALAGTPGWDDAAVRAAVGGSSERSVTLAAPFPVYIFYRTAWVEAGGEVDFRDDVYGHESVLTRALGARAPGSARGREERPAEDDGD